MKKLLTVVLVILMTLVLAGCNGPTWIRKKEEAIPAEAAKSGEIAENKVAVNEAAIAVVSQAFEK